MNKSTLDLGPKDPSQDFALILRMIQFHIYLDSLQDNRAAAASTRTE